MPVSKERKNARTAMLKQVTVDELGRIVIPMPMRKELGIAVRDRLTIKAVDDRIILTKAVSTCVYVCPVRRNGRACCAGGEASLCRLCPQGSSDVMIK